MLLNGCASLAISLAGAGAGAGFSHQMNGAASRTFSAPFDKVDAATRLATKRMFLQVEEVASIKDGQVTKARVKNLEITLELEILSPNLTRADVTARESLFRVDAATAKEIVVQIEQALLAIEREEILAAGRAPQESRASTAKFIPTEPNRKSATATKRPQRGTTVGSL